MADEGGVKKYSEKLFKRVKVSRYLKIHIGILSQQHLYVLQTWKPYLFYSVFIRTFCLQIYNISFLKNKINLKYLLFHIF